MYVAIDVGGTKIHICAFTELKPNSLADEVVIDTVNDFTVDSKHIVESLRKFPQISAIGIALPGFVVDENLGVISAANLASWEMRDVKNELLSIVEKDNIFLLHDAKAHALAELVFAEVNNPFLNIAWGTGVGGTYVKKIGEIIHTQQIELGFQTVNGKYLEELVGGVHLEKRFQKPISEFSDKEWDVVTEDMSTGVANLLALNYAPQIIWGGGVALKQTAHIEEIMKQAAKKFPFWPQPEHRFSTFQEKGGVMGTLAQISLAVQ
jgi:predicted NBD/HSP70 family sugar kinase